MIYYLEQRQRVDVDLPIARKSIGDSSLNGLNVADVCAGDFPIAPTGVLLVDGAEVWHGGELLRKDHACNWDHFLRAVFRVLEERRAPGVPVDAATGEHDRGGGKLAGQVAHEMVALQGALEEVAGVLDHLLVGVGGLKISNEEGVRAGDRDLVREGLEDGLLHLDDLDANVGTVTDVDQIAELDGINLLVLGRNEEAGDPNKLKPGSIDLALLEVAVEKIDGKVDSLRNELEL